MFEENRDSDQVRHEVKLKDQDCQVFYDKLTFIYLEMPKFTKTESELKTDFDKWMYVLKHLPDLEDRPPALQERVFQKLFEAAEIARFDPQEKAKYEQSLKYYRDLKNVIDTSYEEGREEGREKGIKEGREKGIKEGRKEGRKEGKEEKEREVILRSHQSGLDISAIAEITNKTTKEIEKILKENTD